MKGFTHFRAATGFALLLLLTASCSDRNNTSDVSPSEDQQDTTLVDTRRNSTDTVNYLTKDSSKSAQDVIDPNPPSPR